jgi:hypothetical protein
VAIFAAGIAAGVANAVVGGGTLVAFPALIGFGYVPLVANVSTTTGLVFGNAMSIATWRRELQGQRSRAIRLGSASITGGITGAVLLFALPASAFEAIVPVFVALGVVLVVVQPVVARYLATRNRGPSAGNPGWAAWLGLFVAGLYGGYFGAGQGLVIIAVLGLALSDSLHRLNALRNVLAGATNAVAAIAFIVAAPIAWGAAVLIASGSIIGGWIGVHIGRRLSSVVYRAVIVIIGIAAFVKLTVA